MRRTFGLQNEKVSCSVHYCLCKGSSIVADCDSVLLQKTVITEHWEIHELLAIFSLVTQDNYATAKTQFGASVPGYFDGDYLNFSQKRDQMYSQYSYKYSRDESRTIVQTFLPPEAYEAWVQCMVHNDGLICGSKPTDANTGTVEVTWRRPPGLNGLLGRKISLGVASSAIISDGFSGAEAWEGTGIVLIRRDPNIDITGVASGFVKTDGGIASFSTHFVVPKQKEPPKPQRWEADVGRLIAANIEITPEPIERELSIYGRVEAEFENDGNPWFELSLSIDGALVWTQRHDTGFNNNVLEKTITRSLARNQKIKLTANTDNFRTKAKRLYLRVDATPRNFTLAALMPELGLGSAPAKPTTKDR